MCRAKCYGLGQFDLVRVNSTPPMTVTRERDHVLGDGQRPGFEHALFNAAPFENLGHECAVKCHLSTP